MHACYAELQRKETVRMQSQPQTLYQTYIRSKDAPSGRNKDFHLDYVSFGLGDS